MLVPAASGTIQLLARKLCLSCLQIHCRNRKACIFDNAHNSNKFGNALQFLLKRLGRLNRFPKPLDSLSPHWQ